MMGNFWLLNRRRRWAAVCISKCGCSTLKYHALADDAGLDPATLSHNELHDRVGYAANHFLAPITADPPDGYVRFAVWRDPVDRFLSVMRNFGAGGHARRNFAGLADLDTAAWIDFTLAELRKPTLRQDEHLRRQADYFDRAARRASGALVADALARGALRPRADRPQPLGDADDRAQRVAAASAPRALREGRGAPRSRARPRRPVRRDRERHRARVSRFPRPRAPRPERNGTFATGC